MSGFAFPEVVNPAKRQATGDPTPSSGAAASSASVTVVQEKIVCERVKAGGKPCPFAEWFVPEAAEEEKNYIELFGARATPEGLPVVLTKEELDQASVKRAAYLQHYAIHLQERMASLCKCCYRQNEEVIYRLCKLATAME